MPCSVSILIHLFGKKDTPLWNAQNGRRLSAKWNPSNRSSLPRKLNLGQNWATKRLFWAGWEIWNSSGLNFETYISLSYCMYSVNWTSLLILNALHGYKPVTYVTVSEGVEYNMYNILYILVMDIMGGCLAYSVHGWVGVGLLGYMIFLVRNKSWHCAWCQHRSVRN